MDSMRQLGNRPVRFKGTTLPIWLASMLMPGVTSAQQVVATEAPTRTGETTTALSWGDLTWQIPQPFFMGIRPHTNHSKELLIQFKWEKQSDYFFPVDTHANDMQLDVHIRKERDEDPRNALALIKRINLPFAKVPLFAAAKFNGMTYVGSSSSFHYFALNNEDAYVTCWLIKADRLMPPEVAPDVLSKKFTCKTMFLLPHNTYAWVTNWGVDLNDTAPAFVSAHREILSFIQ